MGAFAVGLRGDMADRHRQSARGAAAVHHPGRGCAWRCRPHRRRWSPHHRSSRCINTGSIGDGRACSRPPSRSTNALRLSRTHPRVLPGAGVDVEPISPARWRCPARVNGPGSGADFKHRPTARPSAPTARSSPWSSGFIRTYLTATTGLDRYVVAEHRAGPGRAAIRARSSPPPRTDAGARRRAGGPKSTCWPSSSAQTSQFANVQSGVSADARK